MRIISTLLLGLLASTPIVAQNSTFYNPVLPGWHSDPSCIQVDGTFYCVTSTFISFPGLPIYASKDLINWKLISHVWNRESQLPGYSWATPGQQQGMYAATIRIHEGIFYVICEYLGVSGKNSGVLFRTKDVFSDSAWSTAVTFVAPKIDPDLFWDDDGKVWVATQGCQIQEMDIETGKMGPMINLWNGTGGVWPEGPHIYKRDGWYYILIAEGGTAQDHAVTIARSRNLTGPYTPNPANPILTNRGTQEYFQTVGHADLFQDLQGKWWGMALATRSGPAYKSYPMGRETVLFPASWPKGDWPILQPVRGKMSGWPLPAQSRDIPGDGPFNEDPDKYDFPVGKPIPRNLVYWRIPQNGTFSVTEKGLTVVPGRNALSGIPGGTQWGARAISFIGRRQTHSTFGFTVDLSFKPGAVGQEAGVVAFLTQDANIQLGLVLLEDKLFLRFKTSTNQTKTRSVPSAWANKPIRFQIHMPTAEEYKFSAQLVGDEATKFDMGTASAELLSGGTGSFVGTLIGVYATCNGTGEGLRCPEGTAKAYFKRWRYTGEKQYYDEGKAVSGLLD
ncbi:glycosyl hydrolase [Dendryphion nanum]|uniref:Glycosyl hydrolase n=1 Tax=Dendryphion nanum TaxID=256645 RepID=A0A9P9IKB7_9PLEO|nr:glycosyl hydrolase [Dendryphion nanum]